MHQLLLIGATEELQTLAEVLEKAGTLVTAASAADAKGRVAAGEVYSAIVVNLLDDPEAVSLGPLSELADEQRPPLFAVIRRDDVARLNMELPWEDFITFPALPQELQVRVRRLTAGAGKSDEANILRRGDLTIDQASYKVFIGTRAIELTYKEFELLKFLALNEGRVCTREMLLNRVWGYDFYGGARTVDVHIRRLRSKVEDGHHTLIETVRNVGYRFQAS